MTFRVPETKRVLTGPMGSDSSIGCNGLFLIRLKQGPRHIQYSVICSDGEGWEHVSISHPAITPTWDEMCQLKAIFWDSEDVVMQLHVAESDHINNHNHCLHLWRPTSQDIPTPPSIMVGLKDLNL